MARRMIGYFVRQLTNWVASWFVPPFRCVSFLESADEIPDRLERNTAVIVGTPHYPKWVAFDCPCGSGHRIMLNLDRTRRPAWSANQEFDRLTISPSVDYYDERRRCHYFIQRGKVVWVGDSFGD